MKREAKDQKKLIEAYQCMLGSGDFFDDPIDVDKQAAKPDESLIDAEMYAKINEKGKQLGNQNENFLDLILKDKKSVLQARD